MSVIFRDGTKSIQGLLVVVGAGLTLTEATAGGPQLALDTAFGLTEGVANGLYLRLDATNSMSATTLITNLNADLLDGQHGAHYLDRANHTGTQAYTTLSYTGLTSGHVWKASSATAAAFAALVEADIPALGAAKITSGTFDDARLSSNVALKNAANVFTATQTAEHATGATALWQTRVTGNANARWAAQADGYLVWGTGSAAPDVNLYRGGNNILQSDDAIVASDFALGGSPASIAGFNLDSLANVQITSVANDQVLKYNSSLGKWVNATDGGGSVSALNDLTDVVITSAAVGHILRHNGTEWVNVALSSYAPSLTGSGASGTWAIAISGNAATAAALQTARTIGGVSFDGTANITVASATGGFTVSGGALALGANSLTMTGSIGATGARVTKGWFTDLECTNAIVGSINGNAATATALQTARTINGVSFDGTANITVAAAAGTLTGATLASGVTASSLTSAASGFAIGGNTALHAGNYNSYAPTLTGTGASGTWAISISGSAAQLNGYASDEAANGSTIVRRNANGYIFGTYANFSSGDSENPTIGQIWTQNTTDSYLRKSTKAHFISQLALVVTSGSYSDPSWITSLAGSKISGNISGNAANITAYTINQSVGTGNSPSFSSVTAGEFTLSSDRRKKEQLEPIEDALDRLMRVRGYTGHFKDRELGDRRRAFLVAQEWEEVLPEIVYQDAEGWLQLSYVGAVPLIVEALKQENQQRAAEAAQLRGRVEQLEHLVRSLGA